MKFISLNISVKVGEKEGTTSKNRKLRGRKENDKGISPLNLLSWFCVSPYSWLDISGMVNEFLLNMYIHPQDYITGCRDVYIDFQFMADDV